MTTSMEESFWGVVSVTEGSLGGKVREEVKDVKEGAEVVARGIDRRGILSAKGADCGRIGGVAGAESGRGYAGCVGDVA
jgi:hypothetical protein